jgi:DNA-binding PadR family transcriptional regulator
MARLADLTRSGSGSEADWPIASMLERLEREGLIRGKSEPLGRRRRRMFTITKAGHTALREWLCQPEAMPFELRDAGDIVRADH